MADAHLARARQFGGDHIKSFHSGGIREMERTRKKERKKKKLCSGAKRWVAMKYECIRNFGQSNRIAKCRNILSLWKKMHSFWELLVSAQFLIILSTDLS